MQQRSNQLKELRRAGAAGGGGAAQGPAGGGGGGNRKMRRQMQRQGIEGMEPVNATRVIIQTAENELVFEGPEVIAVSQGGLKVYQVIGEPEVRELGSTLGSEVCDGALTAEELADLGITGDGDVDDNAAVPSLQAPGEIPEGDIKIVMEQTGKSHAEAKQALEDANGDLAQAIVSLLS
jgi:nascent polypeptide-associated complex subunit alpha